MGNYKPYFKYIKDFTVIVLFIFVMIAVVNTGTAIFTMSKNFGNSEGILHYTSQATYYANILCAGAGFFYSIKLFSAAMNIRADRLGYIKAAFIWGIILSIGMTLFGLSLDFIGKTILELITGYRVEIYSELMWIDMERLNYSTGLLNKILSNLILFNIGFMIGALMYRLKIKYSVLLFVGAPSVAVAYLVNLGLKNPEKLAQIGMKILDILEFLMINQGIAMVAKCVGILLCSVIGFKLLIKAPIQDYAHDLI